MATSTDAAGDVAPRTLVVWVPDWPIVALSRDGDDPPPQGAPIAIFAKGAVVACWSTPLPMMAQLPNWPPIWAWPMSEPGS